MSKTKIYLNNKYILKINLNSMNKLHPPTKSTKEEKTTKEKINVVTN